MKNIKSKSTVFIFCLICTLIFSNFVNAQNFSITGEVNQNDIYTNPEPDSILQGRAQMHAEQSGGTFSIDVDQNGINDFEFQLSAGGSQAWSYANAKVHPLNIENQLIMHEDTIGLSGGDFGDVLIGNWVDSLNTSHTINSSSIFSEGLGFIFTTNCPVVFNYWYDIGDHFIGFRIKPNNEYLYGWIRINISRIEDFYVLTLKDFACNINAFADNTELKLPDYNIWPNPVSDYLNISSDSNKDRISIYNSIGTEVGVFPYENNIRIDMSNYKPGVYYVLFDNNENARKIIVY